MGDLTGKRIDQTFDGLIKTNDEQPIDGTLKGLQDGVGNNLPVEVSTSGVNFTGTVTGDNNTTYEINTIQDGNNVVMELQPDTGGSIDVNFIPGANVTLTSASNRNIEIAASGGGGTPVTYTIAASQPTPTTVDVTLSGSDGSTDTVTLSAGGNVSISTVNDIITFSSTDTNTTYDLDSLQVGSDVAITLVGSDTSLDTVTLVAGTNITLTDDGSNNVTVDAAGGGGDPAFGSVYRGEIRNNQMGGYPSDTWGTIIQPINGRPFMSQAIDQNDDATLWARMYGRPGRGFTDIVIPLFAGGTSDVTIHLYQAGPSTGQPYNKVYSQTDTVTDTSEHFHRMTLTNPQSFGDKDSYWIGINTTNSRKCAQLGGDAGVSNFMTWGAWGGAIQGLLSINTYYWSGVVPNTFPEPFSWSGRDEVLALFYV